MARRMILGALALAGLLAARSPLAGQAGSGGSRPPDLPAALKPLPADPHPGMMLSDAGSRSIEAFLTTLDERAGFGTAREAGAGGAVYNFRLLPYTSFIRFGVPGAAAAEFSAGEQVRLELVARPGEEWRPEACYALAVADAATGQIGDRRGYRMLSQDRDRYEFTVEEAAEAAPAPPAAGAPQRRTLAYGPETLLVLREAPLFTFRLPPGSFVRLNSGLRAGPGSPAAAVAREVLDGPSLARFQAQQRSRQQARFFLSGIPGYMAGPGRDRVQVFPDCLPWARGLHPGDRVRIGRRGAAGAALAVKSVDAEGLITLASPAGDLKDRDRVSLAPEPRATPWAAVLQPMLAANCWSCHRDGSTQSGLSLSSPAAAARGGRRGPGLVPGKPEQSMAYLTTAGDRNPPMPPDRPLTAEQLAVFKRWIESGAPE